MKELLFLIGTRPEAVKMWQVIEQTKKRGLRFRVLLSGQHPDPAPEIFHALGISPKSLSAMTPGEDLLSLFSSLLQKTAAAFSVFAPLAVLVHGDTATAAAGALSAFHLGIPVFHVEAGLRTHDPFSPFPEEAYRRIIASLATLHFAPTAAARQNLLSEGVGESHIFVTGNTAVDAFLSSAGRGRAPQIPPKCRLCLLSLHRRESTSAVSRAVFSAVLRALLRFPSLFVLCTVYPFAASRAPAEELLSKHPRVILSPPTDVFSYHEALRKAAVVLTDSGGVQEEAVAAGVPVLVARTSTERCEGIREGKARLVGIEESGVYQALCDFFSQPLPRTELQDQKNPYGDGHASERILRELESFFKRSGAKVGKAPKPD